MNRHAFFLTSAFLLASPAMAGEKPIGEPVEQNGMEIAAVYLQAVMMEPASFSDVCFADRNAANPPTPTDAHIEADIKGLKGNNSGFAEGEWIPYLNVNYVVTKPGSTFKAAGKLVPMVASDGPHYGANVKFEGPGKYHVAYTIALRLRTVSSATPTRRRASVPGGSRSPSSGISSLPEPVRRAATNPVSRVDRAARRSIRETQLTRTSLLYYNIAQI